MRCALCKEARNSVDLQTFEGRFLCPDCLRLVREEGIVLPPDLEPHST